MTSAAASALAPVAADFERHRRELTGHCYRMLGSVLDAEDAVQETMLRAWKATEGDRFRGQSSVKTWLYRIATNVGLDTIVAAVNSALQRARATLDARNPAVVPRELTKDQKELLARYVEAFEKYDVQALTTLLHEEATMSMPPYELWLCGPESIARWMLTYGSGCRGSRLVPVASACGLPAFAQYRQGGAQPWGLVLVDLDGDRIRSLNYFLDWDGLFPKFGLGGRLSAEGT